MVYDLSVFIWGNAKFSQRVKVITGYAFGVCIYLSEWNYFLQLLPITHTWELVCQEIIDLSPGMSLSWVLSETRTKLPQWVEQHLMDGDNRFDCLRLKKKKLLQEVVNSPSMEESKLSLGGHWVVIKQKEFQSLASQSLVPEPDVLVLPGSLLQKQSPRPHLRLTESEFAFWQDAPSDLYAQQSLRNTVVQDSF